LGYKLYFGKKTACGDSSFCQFGGQSSIQGSSPVNIPLTDLSDPTNPSYNLDGLDEGDWCFRMTAYNEIGESNPTSALSIAIDTITPSVSITAPTTAPNFTTTNSTINIAGEALDNLCVDSVSWTSSTGGSGTASGTAGWSQENILLQEGDNLLTVTANDSAGNTAEASMTVTYTPPPPDVESPVITITDPTSSETYQTSSGTLNITGTAADNVEVARVTWTNDRGGSGTATRITSWAIANIILSEGNNVITVTATDTSGNSSSDTLTVSFILPPGTYTAEFGDATASDYPGTCLDTYINSPTINRSTEPTLNTYTWPTGVSANKIIMQWDLSVIPLSAKVQNAILYLYLNAAGSGDAQYEITAHKAINVDPDISRCTWDTYDGVNSWTGGAVGAAQDMGPVLDSQVIDKSTGGYKAWTITNLAADWVAHPSANYGVILDSDDTAASDSHRYFSSSDHTDSNQRPKLIVTYTKGSVSDTTSPTIDGQSPARGAVDVPINTDIVFHLKDTGVGVDQSSIVMTVEGTVVSLTSITGTPADCTVTYNPVTDFGYQQVVNVTIDASDLAGNAMAQDVYSFTTITEPDTIPPTGTITIKGGDSLTRSTSIPVAISATDDGGSGVVGWLVSETQTTPPASDDAGWLPTAPTSYTLSSGDGLKTLYAWFKDGAGNISSSPATDEILLDTSTLKFNVTIELNNDPIDICFAPDQPLKANPFVTLETGNGFMTPASGARVSPISDPCSDSPTYCVSYVPDVNDTTVDIRIDEDQTNPVIPESPGYAIASFFVTDPDQERATSFCIFNSQGGDNFLLHQQCEEFVSVECDPGVLYRPGQDLNPDECVLMRIVEIDPVSIPASPGIMATGLYDITLPDGVEIAPGKTITITFGFKLTNGLTQKDFDDGLWFFNAFYYDETISDWKSSGITVTDIQWDSDNSGIVVFTTTHLTKFVVSMKQSVSKGSIGSSSDKNLSASGGSGGGGCSVNNKAYGLSAGSVLVNILILFLPFVVNGIRSRYMARRKKCA